MPVRFRSLGALLAGAALVVATGGPAVGAAPGREPAVPLTPLPSPPRSPAAPAPGVTTRPEDRLEVPRRGRRDAAPPPSAGSGASGPFVPLPPASPAPGLAR